MKLCPLCQTGKLNLVEQEGLLMQICNCCEVEQADDDVMRLNKQAQEHLNQPIAHSFDRSVKKNILAK